MHLSLSIYIYIYISKGIHGLLVREEDVKDRPGPTGLEGNSKTIYYYYYYYCYYYCYYYYYYYCCYY